MKRPTFTIVDIKQIRYDANHLRICHKMIDNHVVEGVSFLCSGGETFLRDEDVFEIRFAHANAEWCSECDNSIANISFP